jgi:hypothetical protein
MTTSEIDPQETATEDAAREDQQASPDGNWSPNTPPPSAAPTGNWSPNTPPPNAAPTGNWSPNTPPPSAAPEGNWSPNTPPPSAAPTGNWSPNTPPPNAAPTGNWSPNNPPSTVVTDGNGTASTPPAVLSNGNTPTPNDLANGNGAAKQGGPARTGIITHLWSSTTAPGVWVLVYGVGWKRLAASEFGHGALTTLALLARANGLPVSFHEDAVGQIDELLV